MKFPKLSKTEILHLTGALLSPFVIAGIDVFQNGGPSSALATDSSFTHIASTISARGGVLFITLIIGAGLLTFMQWARLIKRPSPGSIEPVPVKQESWKKFIAWYWVLTAGFAAFTLIK